MGCYGRVFLDSGRRPKIDKVNEYLKRNYHSRVYDGVVEIPQITKHIECNDGFVISVQASDVHCCEPRRIKAWPYSEVELGFPSELDELIADYANKPDTTETVFAYVPIDIVNQLVEKHGGIKE